MRDAMSNFFRGRLEITLDDAGLHAQRGPASLVWHRQSQTQKSPSLYEVPYSNNAKFNAQEFIAIFQKLFIECIQKTQASLLDFVIPDQWVRHFLVQIPKNARGSSDCHAAAQKRFLSLYGDDVNAWHIDIDIQLRGMSLACAIPTSLKEALDAVEREHKVTFVRAQSSFISTWNKLSGLLKKDDWVGFANARTMLLAMRVEGCWYALSQIERSDDLSELAVRESIETCIEKEAMKHCLGLPKRIILAGDIPMTWRARSIESNGFWIFTPSLSYEHNREVIN